MKDTADPGSQLETNTSLPFRCVNRMLHPPVVISAMLAALSVAAVADAQTYTPKKARRQFVTVSTDWLNTQPLHFLEHPLQDLVGRAVATAQFQDYEYRTRDEAI